jgi:hypothetical protein
MMKIEIKVDDLQLAESCLSCQNHCPTDAAIAEPRLPSTQLLQILLLAAVYSISLNQSFTVISNLAISSSARGQQCAIGPLNRLRLVTAVKYPALPFIQKCTLVFSPWHNYPCQGILSPLASQFSVQNCTIVITGVRNRTPGYNLINLNALFQSYIELV